MKPGSRLKLLLLMALFASPALAAWLAHAWWQPSRFSNYGTLLEPRVLNLPPLVDGAGKAVPWSDMRGRWVLLVAMPGACDAACAHATYLARQARLAQGMDQARVVRVLVATEATRSWPYGDGAYRVALDRLPTVLAQGGLFLVDPRGRLMMGYPVRADGAGVIRDLRQLLRVSREG